MGSAHYMKDEAVFPQDLVDKCREKLSWHGAIIYFRAEGPLGSAERRLGKELALQCRQYCSKMDVSRVYFGGARRRRPRVHQLATKAARLSAMGHTLQAIADVLGVARQTVNAWGPSTRSRGARGHSNPVVDADVLREGLELLNKQYRLKPRESVEADIERLANALDVQETAVRTRALAAGWAKRDLEKISLDD